MELGEAFESGLRLAGAEATLPAKALKALVKGAPAVLRQLADEDALMGQSAHGVSEWRALGGAGLCSAVGGG